MSFHVMLQCMTLCCCIEPRDTPYRRMDQPALHVPILETSVMATKGITIPAPGSPYQTPTQIKITPPLLPQ